MNMNIGQKLDWINELQDQVGEFSPLSRDPIKLSQFYKRAKMYFRKMFGEDSVFLGELEIAYDGVIQTLDFDGDTYRRNLEEFKKFFDTIEGTLEMIVDSSPDPIRSLHTSAPINNKVFVVHGHDKAMQQEVARTLERLGLDAIILQEMPNQGRTIIEKFFDHSDVSFAVVLLSPDDMGYSIKAGPDKARTRARQNVILELGFFLGKIGRRHVVALRPQDENFEAPSDYDGVVYLNYDALSDGWKYGLVKELQACGFDVDANKLTR